MKNLYTIFNDPGEFPRTAVGLAATVALVGIILLWRRRPALSCSSAATTSALLVAGFLGMYPIGQRFLVFLLPLVVLCLAEGIAGIMANAPRLLAAGRSVGVVGVDRSRPCVGTAAKRLVGSSECEEIEPLLQRARLQWRQGDVLYLYPRSQYAFRYYVECSDCGPIRVARASSGPRTRPAAASRRQRRRSFPTRQASS